MIFTKNRSMFLNLLLLYTLSISTNILYGMQVELVLLPKTFFDNTDNSSSINLPQDTPKSINKDGSLSDIIINKKKLSLHDNNNLGKKILATPEQIKTINIYANSPTQSIYIITEKHYFAFNSPQNFTDNAITPTSSLKELLVSQQNNRRTKNSFSSSSSSEEASDNQPILDNSNKQLSTNDQFLKKNNFNSAQSSIKENKLDNELQNNNVSSGKFNESSKEPNKNPEDENTKTTILVTSDIVGTPESSSDTSTEKIEETFLTDQEFLKNQTNINNSDETLTNLQETEQSDDTQEEAAKPSRFILEAMASKRKEEEAITNKIKQLKQKMIETLDLENNNRPGSIHFYVRPSLNSNYNSIKNFSVLKFNNFIDTELIKKINDFKEITSEIMENHLKYETSYVSIETFKDQQNCQVLEKYLTENQNVDVVAHYQDTITKDEIYCRILSLEEFAKREEAKISFDQKTNEFCNNDALKRFSTPLANFLPTDNDLKKIISEQNQKNTKKNYFKVLLGGGVVSIVVIMAYYFNLLPDVIMTNLHSLFNKLPLPTSFFAR